MKKNMLLAAGLLMSILIGSCTRESHEKATNPDVISFSSLPNGKTEIEYSERGQQHKVEWQGSKITALYINGKKMSEETHAMHKATGENIFQQLKTDRQTTGILLTPPKAKGPEAGKEKIIVVDLLSGNSKNELVQETKDQEQVKRESKANTNSNSHY